MKFRLFVLILFTTTALVFAQGQDWYMGKPIRAITFSDLNNISPSELEVIMQPYYGRILDDIIFWEIQGKLYALEYFDRIEPYIYSANADESEVIIRFNVVERLIIGRINFSGNSGLRNRDLNNVIRTKVDNFINKAKIRVDVEAIKNLYIEKGYPNVIVNTEETQARDGTITLTFHITEQEKISISRIEFQGNSRFSSNVLRGRLSLKQKSLINDGAFQESKLLADIETITNYYYDRGYVDAVVRDVTRTYETDAKGTNLILTFRVEEGSQFTFGGVTFEGNQIFTTEQLSKLVTSKAGDILNVSKLETDLQNVADMYLENGYIFNSINRIPNKNYQTNVFSVLVSIVERNRAYIEDIIIIGNEKTRTDVILREIPLEPGDVFSKTKIYDALRNLYNLQYFSLVIPDTLPGSTENLMELIFTVEEQMTTDVQVGLTFSGSADGSFPISGILEWTDRNLAGSGNELGVKLNSNVSSSTTVALNYIHRWLFGLPLSLGADFSADFISQRAPMSNGLFNGDEEYAFPAGFSSFAEYKDSGKLVPDEYLMEYKQTYLSLGLSSGYRWLTPLGSLSVSGGLRLGFIINDYDKIFSPFDPVLRNRNGEWTPRNSIWASVSLDKRDIYYDPSDGFYLSERLSLSGIFNGEPEYYVRSDSKAQYFLTLFDIPVFRNWNFKSVLAVNLGFSLITGQPGRALSIETANMLAVDGMFNARGWNEAYNDKGYLLLDTWVELRFPLVKGILAFDLFFDAAGVEAVAGKYLEKDNFTINEMRFSFGGGLRIAMPQFPIRLSMAKRFRYVNGDFTWVGGSLFQNKSDPTSGIDLVLSFVMSY
jgi:outer membrane protein insertion porin family